MAPRPEQRQKAERLVSLAASLREVTHTTSRPVSRRPRRRTWIFVAAGALLIAVIPFVRGLRPVDFFVRRWQLQSSLLTDAQAASRVRQLANLGESGVPLLVDALTDSRALVVEAAQETLHQNVLQWKELPLKDASRRAAMLVNRLRANTTKISPAAVDGVRAMVIDILHWPIDHDATDSVALIADCEHVLSGLHRPRASDQQAQAIAELPVAEPIPANHAIAVTDIDEPSPALPEVELVEESPITVSGDEQFQTSAPAAPNALNEPAPLALLPARTSSNPANTERIATSSIDLARQLLDPRAEVVVTAANELKRRGFQTDHISLLERLFDSNPTIRRAALDEIPRSTNFDGRPWLKHLSEDSDLGVRRAAIALLATSNDPDTLRHLRQLETTEKDTSILEMIRKQR